MKSNVKLFLCLIMALGFVVSCKKETASATADITLMEPLSGDTVPNGEALHMHGTITGSGELHGYTLTLTNVTTNEVVFSGSNTSHQTNYAFDEHWVNNVASISNMKVTVTVELDHDGNTTTKEVFFTAQ